MGSLLALISRRSLIACAPNPLGAGASWAVGYAVFFWLSVTVMVVRAPDWMLCYFVPAREVPLAVAHALFLLCLCLAALSGHVLTAVQLQRHRLGGAIATLLAGLVLWGGLWALSLERYIAFGDHAAWLAGSTVPITDSAVAGWMNIVGVADALGFAVVVAQLVRQSRRLRAR